MAAGTLNIEGDFEVAALGSFAANTSTAIFDGASSQSITSAGNSFNAVTFNSTGGTVSLVDDFSAASVTHTLGSFNPSAQDITVSGNYTMAAGSVSASTGTYDLGRRPRY